MYKISIAAILVLCFLEITNGYCCFREPFTLAPTCGCNSQPAYVVGQSVCDCGQAAYLIGPSTCGCDQLPYVIGPTNCGCDHLPYLIGPSTCGCDQYPYYIGSRTCGCGQRYIIGSSCDCVQNPCSECFNPISFCDCGVPTCSCFRDTCNVCSVCEQPSPLCSCMKAANGGNCGCDGMRSCIYFPEVEYPVVAVDMKPFYYGSCFSC